MQSPRAGQVSGSNRQGDGSTGWGDAICVIPLVLHDRYADRDIVVEALPAMARWNDFVFSISNGPIVRPPKEWGARGFTFGDWLQPVGGKWPLEKPFRTIGDDASATWNAWRDAAAASWAIVERQAVDALDWIQSWMRHSLRDQSPETPV